RAPTAFPYTTLFRSDGGGDRRESRPRADGAPAIRFVKRGADNRQAPRHQERGARALHRARDNERPCGGGEPARGRGGGEHEEARSEEHTSELQSHLN